MLSFLFSLANQSNLFPGHVLTQINKNRFSVLIELTSVINRQLFKILVYISVYCGLFNEAKETVIKPAWGKIQLCSLI